MSAAEPMMDVPKSVQPFWDTFQASIAYDASPLFYEAFHFDDNERVANALGALVLSGQKRATAGLLWTNEVTSKPLPSIGALSVVTDWHGTPLCVIQTTHVEIVPFESVSDGFAATEGEGDKTLGYWRDAHWKFFSRECQRIGREPNLRMPVVCEQFKVVYPTWRFRPVRLPDGVAGRLRLHSMPGRHEPIDQVWQQIQSDAIQVIVCLAGSQEIRTTSPSYAAAIEAKTVPCSVESFPITDFGVPSDREALWSLASSIATRLKAGGRILIHCGAGIGRTGTLATSVLVALGEPRVHAEQAVSAAGSRPETVEQRALVAWCAAVKNAL